MYLAQTNLEINTEKIYDLNGQEVYLSTDKKALVTKTGYESLGRDTNIYGINYQRKRDLKEKFPCTHSGSRHNSMNGDLIRCMDCGKELC